MKFYHSSSPIEAAPDLIWSILASYTLVPEGSKTTFTMRGEYTGLFLPMIWKSIPDLQPSFDQFAQGLQAEAERRAAG